MRVRQTALVLITVVAAACSAVTPTQAPTASPTPPPTATPQPTATPVPFRSSEFLVLHPAGSDESPLGYIEYSPPLPEGASLAYPPPLLVFFHGSEESGDGDASSLNALYVTGIPRVIKTNAWPEDRPFVVLMPQFGPTSQQCTDSGLIDEFLKFAVDHYNVDRQRVYLTGLSCGAYGTWDYLGEHTNELVAAAVPIAGDGHYAFDTAGCNLGKVPIWAIHGGNDQNVDVSGSVDPIAALNACTDPPPVDARINVYPGVGHAVWQPFYDGTKSGVDIYAWMLGHTNPTASTPEPIYSSMFVTLQYAGTVDGAPLGYLEYLPPDYGDGELRPLIVFTHGGGENGTGGPIDLARITAEGIPKMLDTDAWPVERPFVILAPQFMPDPGSLCGNGAQLDEFLNFAIAHYDVDPTRVYVTGLSCGAYVAWEYLGQHTDEIVAAAVLIAGDGIEAFAEAGCDLGRVPIWAIHGAADEVVPVSGSVDPITSLNECTDPPPADARLGVIPGGSHFIWQPFYEGTAPDIDIYAWMLGHSNPAD